MGVKLCSKNKDKKSESNSQLFSHSRIVEEGCVRRTKIKNLKAIHNAAGGIPHNQRVVFEEQR